MLHSLTDRIAQFFYKQNIINREDYIEIYSYGLELIISSVINVLAVLVISLFFNQLWQTVVFLAAFISIRTYAGGYHAKTHLRCFLILIFVYGINLASIMFIQDNSFITIVTIMISMVISIVLIGIFSPLDDSNKPLTENERHRSKRISYKILILQVMIIALVLALQLPFLIALCITNGQLAASTSLLAAKIRNKVEDGKNEKGNVRLSQI